MNGEMHGAIVSLFSMHLVRSMAMRDRQLRLYAESIDDLIADVETDNELRRCSVPSGVGRLVRGS